MEQITLPTTTDPETVATALREAGLTPRWSR